MDLGRYGPAHNARKRAASLPELPFRRVRHAPSCPFRNACWLNALSVWNIDSRLDYDDPALPHPRADLVRSDTLLPRLRRPHSAALRLKFRRARADFGDGLDAAAATVTADDTPNGTPSSSSPSTRGRKRSSGTASRRCRRTRASVRIRASAEKSLGNADATHRERNSCPTALTGRKRGLRENPAIKTRRP